jgi:hypothetical protein
MSQYICVMARLLANIKQPLWSNYGAHLFKYAETQYLSYLAHNLLSEVICSPHVRKCGDPDVMVSILAFGLKIRGYKPG